MNLSFETFTDVGIFWLLSIPAIAGAAIVVVVIIAIIAAIFSESI